MTNWINHPLKLIGEKVILAPLEKSHFDDLVRFSKNNLIWEMWYGRTMPEEELRNALKEGIAGRVKGEQYPFVVIDKSSNKIIGSTRYLKLDNIHKKLEIGWTFYLPEYWGTGANEECKLLLLTNCFEELKTGRVEFIVSETNTRSRKAIERIGAKLEGLHRNFVLRKTGRINAAVYSIIEEEWPETKNKLTELVRRKRK